jgi:nucleoside 2-deoxyribosyltransferase
VLGDLDCYAIRIDKEAPLEGLVDRIKEEIRKANFIVADLTDERPSCYFEVGYAEALGVPVIHLASKQSVIYPGTDTKIHFDIHKNVNFFVNHKELEEKLRVSFQKNRERLLAPRTETSAVEAAR